MMTLVAISQALLYPSLALLVGYASLQLVSTQAVPAIRVPYTLLRGASALIAICSLLPAYAVIHVLVPSLGLLNASRHVLFTLDVGIAACCIVLCCLLLSIQPTTQPVRRLVLLALIMLALAWTSHARGVAPFQGLLSDFMHLLAVSIWAGVILVVSWFSIATTQWLAFLRWFSPLASLCLLLTAVSGLLLTDTLVPQYTIAPVTYYGTGLLLKHLFLIPLLFYALVNGVIMRRKLMQDTTFQPIPWMRLESILLLTIFTITALYSQQATPTDHLTATQLLPFFVSLTDIVTVQFTLSLESYVLLSFAILFAMLAVASFMKRLTAVVSLCMAIFGVLCLYGALMVSFHIMG